MTTNIVETGRETVDPFGLPLLEADRVAYESWLDTMDAGRVVELEALSDRAREEFERDPHGDAE